MNIWIITTGPFPEGGAATNRIISYGKGFINNRINVNILCLIANLYGSDYLGEAITKGKYKNIPFQYASNSSKRSSSFLKRRWINFYGTLRSIYILVKESRARHIDAIILHSNSFYYATIFRLVSSLIHAKLIQEKSEFPFVLKNKSIRGKLWATFYIKIFFKYFDGMLVESQRLHDYFISKINHNAKLLIVPATIDHEPILMEPKSNLLGDYIFYGGTLDREKKDGVDLLIKSFKKVALEFPTLKLILTGFARDAELKYYEDLINELALSDKVILAGKVSRGELNRYLKNAKVLALAKEDDEIMSGGLSSKIIEYLYTGNPIVLTELGSITEYLQDKKTAFFAKAGDKESFTKALLFALKNPELAKKIGKQGQEFATGYFDANIHTKRIIDFIKQL